MKGRGENLENVETGGYIRNETVEKRSVLIMKMDVSRYCKNC